MTRNRRLARLLIAEAVLVVFLFAFALTFRIAPSRTVFTGGEGESYGEIASPTIYSVLWGRYALAKTALKAGFPLINHVETSRVEKGTTSVATSILSWFLGFELRGAHDLLMADFPGFSGGLAVSSPVPSGLEEDWGVTPVLYSLSSGGDVQAASIDLSPVPTVAIYHTHATESYLPEVGKTVAESAFSNDSAKTVVRVGEYLVSELENRYRIACVHSRTVHDQDSRVGAYYRSEQTVKALLDKYPSFDLLVDLHRDSQPRNITAVTIKGKTYARLMLVVGTDNPRWVDNYALAKKIVGLLEDAYPGISRGILYASAQYNQQYSPKAVLVEVGGVDNKLEECKNSMEALAWAIASITLPTAPKSP